MTEPEQRLSTAALSADKIIRNTTSTARSMQLTHLEQTRMVLPQTIIHMWDRHIVSCVRSLPATKILKPAPPHPGDVIPVSGDGDLTNDDDMEPLLS